MKSITRLGKRLLSMFLVLVASSMMFLSYPAIAATTLDMLDLNTLDDATPFETEVLKYDKPVVVIVVPFTRDGESFAISLEDLKSQAEKTFGDKYKIAIGTLQESPNIYHSNIGSFLRVYPPASTVSVFKQGKEVDESYFLGSDPTRAFESIKTAQQKS